MRRLLFCFALCLAHLPVSASGQAVGLPPAPELSAKGWKLILEFETGGRAGYVPRPIWPKLQSGVTVGIGYDLGYNSAAVIRRDWRALPHAPRLATAAGIIGTPAKPKAAALRDILIQWELATDVFAEVSVARFYALTARTFPGLEALPMDAQAALVSCVFNRGNSLVGDRRREMRAIRAAVARKDLDEIARQLRAMCRIWRGTVIEKGMTRRRLAEAAVVEQAAK